MIAPLQKTTLDYQVSQKGWGIPEVFPLGGGEVVQEAVGQDAADMVRAAAAVAAAVCAGGVLGLPTQMSAHVSAGRSLAAQEGALQLEPHVSPSLPAPPPSEEALPPRAALARPSTREPNATTGFGFGFGERH